MVCYHQHCDNYHFSYTLSLWLLGWIDWCLCKSFVFSLGKRLAVTAGLFNVNVVNVVNVVNRFSRKMKHRERDTFPTIEVQTYLSGRQYFNNRLRRTKWRCRL